MFGFELQLMHFLQAREARDAAPHRLHCLSHYQRS
jgi:hypothetical protein